MTHQRTQQSREIKKRRKFAQLDNYSISCCSTKEHLLWQIGVVGGFREKVRANDVKMDSIPVEAAYLLEAQAKKICQLQKEVDDLFATNARLRRRLDETGIAYVYNIKSSEWSFQCPPRQ